MQNSASAFSTKDSIGSSLLAHARYLHGAGKGKATVGHKNHSEAWVQNSYSVEELYKVLPTYTGLNDVYITQNRFYGSRATDRIAELSALYSDLDYYKIPDLADQHAVGVLDGFWNRGSQRSSDGTSPSAYMEEEAIKRFYP